MTWLLVIVAALAVYRVAHLVAYEDGPADVFVRVRSAVIDRFGHASWQARGITCPLCVSFWLGLLVAPLLLWPTAPWWLWWPIVGLALSAVTVLIEKVTPDA